MEFKHITYEKRDGIAKITLNRPDVLNAISIEMKSELNRVLDGIEEDAEVRVVVITGAGDKAFCAGADISVFKGRTPLAADEYSRFSKGPLDRIENLSKPVIAAVNGYALGGGCELAMACDIIVATKAAKFGQPEIRIGIIPGAGGTQRLPRHVGVKRAKELIMTGRMIDAFEAERIGLVNKVVNVDALETSVNEMAASLIEKSPVILKLAKEAVNQAMEEPLRAGLDTESRLFALCFSTEDQNEGVTAFLEKRKPVFKGR